MIEENEIFIEFIRDPSNELVGVSLDIIDFLILCHAGRDKKSAVFTHLLETVRELNEESTE